MVLHQRALHPSKSSESVNGAGYALPGTLCLSSSVYRDEPLTTPASA